MVYAFVSYSHKDRQFIERFVIDAKNNHIPYWRDWDDIPPWAAWDDDIEKELRGPNITHFLYFHSDTARQSDNVKNEIHVARENKRIKIVVLKLDHSPVPMTVIRRNHIDFTEDYDDSFNRLLGWLRKDGDHTEAKSKKEKPHSPLLEPTRSQQKAAQNGTDYQVRVIAGPGTGKSFVIEERVRWLLSKQVAPDNIFVASFTRRASSDLADRIRNYCLAKGQDGADEVSVSTLHSLALKALKKSNSLADMYPTDPSVLTNWETSVLFDDEFKFEYRQEFAQKDNRAIKNRAPQIRRYYEALWSTGDSNPTGYDLPEIEITDKEKTSFRKFHRTFSGVYSTVLPGELITQCVERAESGLLDLVSLLEIQHFIVDEVQDLNYADNRFIDIVAHSQTHPKVYVLGDDDQSIYAFRFAYPQGIQTFKSKERHPNTRDYTLSECFRCTPNILTAATSLITVNSPTLRLPKDLVPHHRDIPGVVRGLSFASEQKEANFIAQSCKELIESGVNPDDILVLISSRDTQLKPIVEAFKKEDVSAHFPSKKGLYYSNSWISFAYGLLRVACDKDLTDYVAHRLVLGSLKGVGLGTCVKIKNNVANHNLNYLEIFYHPLPDKIFSTTERKSILRAAEIFEAICNWESKDTLSERSEAIADLIVSACKDQTLRDEWIEFISSLPEETTLKDLRSLIGAQNREQVVHVWQGIQERLDNDPLENDFLKPCVQVMTMHNAKGLNAKVVFVPGLESEIIPGARRRGRQGLVHEAARLLYVSITRSSAACIMTFATSRQIGGKRDFGRQGTDFIRDLGVRFIQGSTILSRDDIEEIVDTVDQLRQSNPSSTDQE
jgi:DNA helicase II / ATP-dependent DNA helicase PcrA